MNTQQSNEDETTPHNRTGEADPAASMSLLTNLLANPLDSGYESWEKHGAQAPAWWDRALTVLLSFALALGLTVAVRTLRSSHEHDVEEDLLERARSTQSTISALEDEVQSLSNAVEDGAGLPSANENLDPAVSLAVSARAVSGPGLVVTLSDSLNTAAPGGGLVRDQDIRVVVNALWSAGAEAVTVDGIRVGPGTFIRTAGSSVLVNITATSAPYEIAAIGDANALSTALVRGSTGDYLSSVEAVTGISLATRAASSLSMPALDSRTLRHASAWREGQ